MGELSYLRPWGARYQLLRADGFVAETSLMSGDEMIGAVLLARDVGQRNVAPVGRRNSGASNSSAKSRNSCSRREISAGDNSLLDRSAKDLALFDQSAQKHGVPGTDCDRLQHSQSCDLPNQSCELAAVRDRERSPGTPHGGRVEAFRRMTIDRSFERPNWPASR